MSSEKSGDRGKESCIYDIESGSPVGLFCADSSGNFTFVNHRWCHITNLSPQEALGMGWVSGLFPPDKQRVLSDWSKSIREQRDFQLQFRFRSGHCEPTWVLCEAKMHRSPDGAALGFVGSITDVTGLKREEEAFRLSEQRLALHFVQTPLAVIEWNLNFEVKKEKN